MKYFLFSPKQPIGDWILKYKNIQKVYDYDY